MVKKQRPFIGPVQLKVVNFGIDTFLANFKLAGDDGKPNGDTLPERNVVLLDTWQQVARKEHEPQPTPLEYNGKTLYIRPHGKNVWSWMLFNEDVSLTMAHGSMSGGVFCQARFSSHLLWSLNVEECLIAMQSVLYDFTQQNMYVQASEIHICADVQGWYDFYDGSLDWQSGFVSRVVAMRARPDEPTEQEQAGGMSPRDIQKLNDDISMCAVPTTTHRRLATLDFGTHGSQIMGQIYNKSEEIKKSRKTFFEPIWRAHGWDGLSEITRFEIRARRGFLGDHDLNEAFSTLEQIALLWDYATQKWLRYVDLDASGDTNKSRLATNCVWECIQSACSYVDPDSLSDTRGELETRLQSVLEKKPLELIQQAEVMELQERLQDEHTMSDEDIQARIMTDHAAILDSLRNEPISVLRDMARERIETLAPEHLKPIVDHLSPAPFSEVRTELIKRARHMAKKKACVAAFTGYLTSIMALSANETAEQPDVQASLIVAFEEVNKYNKSRNRSFLEHVWKKRLAYGFVTARQVEEEVRLHGLDLSDEDWEHVRAEMKALTQQNNDIYLNSSAVA